MITDIRNPRWADDEKTKIIIDCKLADGEEVTFVASPNDCTDYGPKIYQDCLDGVYGKISDYTPPELSIEQKEKSERLKAEIRELELKQLRSLKAIMGEATEEDEKIYNEIEAEIQAKREEIRGLEDGN